MVWCGAAWWGEVWWGVVWCCITLYLGTGEAGTALGTVRGPTEGVLGPTLAWPSPHSSQGQAGGGGEQPDQHHRELHAGLTAPTLGARLQQGLHRWHLIVSVSSSLLSGVHWRKCNFYYDYTRLTRVTRQYEGGEITIVKMFLFTNDKKNIYFWRHIYSNKARPELALFKGCLFIFLSMNVFQEKGPAIFLFAKKHKQCLINYIVVTTFQIF